MRLFRLPYRLRADLAKRLLHGAQIAPRSRAMARHDSDRGKAPSQRQLRVGELIRRTIRRAGEAGAPLHVSLDVDFLDPDVAPAVGTTVPGGATVREAHLAMELLHESGRVASLDIVELNPFLDERGRTATLMVDLAASLFGRTIMDRPTKAW